MSYGLKYICEFTSVDGKQHKIEIRDKNKINDSSPIILTALPSAIISVYPKFNISKDVVRGRGITLNVIYKGNIYDLRSLYTTDMKKYKVFHFIDDEFNFLGYLDSEIYEEDFSRSPEDGVEVQLVANNGFSLFERLPYCDSISNNQYNYKIGLTPLLTFVFDCIDKLELVYEKLYFSSSTTSPINEISNVLEDIYLNFGNWIDEDGNPLNCKEVIENVLGIFQLSMTEKSGNIYITDNEAKLSSSIIFQVYEISTRKKMSSENVDNLSQSIESLKNVQLNTTIRYDKVINNQKVVCDNYPVKEVLNAKFEPQSQYSSLLNSKSYSTIIKWNEYRYSKHTNFTKFSGLVSFNYVEEDISKDLDFFASVKCDDKNINRTYDNLLKTIPNGLYCVGLSKLKLNFKFMFRKLDDYLNSDAEHETMDEVYVGIKIKIGEYWYKPATNFLIGGYEPAEWQIKPETEPQILLVFSSHDAPLEMDKWHDFKYKAYVRAINIDENYSPIISVPEHVNGQIEFYLTKYIACANYGKGFQSLDDIEFRIKDIQITTLDSNAEIIKEDVFNIDNEYEGKGDLLAKSKGSDIKLLVGSGYHPYDSNNHIGVPTLSQLLYKNSNNAFKGVQYFSRGLNNKDNHLLEELLLSSIIGNYREKSELLKLKCNYDEVNLNAPFVSSYINYNNSKLIFIGGQIDYQKNEIEMTLRTLKNDDEI